MLREITLSTLGRRTRLPGESLWGLANDVECLTRRAYGHTPPAIQGELGRDRFIMALSPPELHAQTQLACPRSLQEALDVALRHEFIWGEATGEKLEALLVIRAAEPCLESGDKPLWATEITKDRF